MRLAFHNLIDDLNASTLSALSETTGYEVTQVQDQRLTTTWKSSSATSQTVLATLPTLPEYPDDPSGVTYFQDTWATNDSWLNITGGTAASVSGGRLISTVGQIGVYRVLTSSLGQSVRYKITRLAGATATLSAGFRRTGTGTYDSVTLSSIAIGETKVYDIVVPSAAATYDVVRIVEAADSSIAIDFIYIGTGAYLSNSLLDLSGNANHGTIYGATPVDTPYGRGLSGDGVNDYVSMGNVCDISTGSFSVSIYYKPTALGVTMFMLAKSDGINAITSKGYLLYLGATGTRISFGVFDGAANKIVAALADAVAGTTYHIVGVFNKSLSIAYLYVNGVLQSQSSNAALGSISVPDSLYLLRAATIYDNGTIAQPRIYNRALSAEEVLNLYNQTPLTTENDGLAGFWDVDHGLGVDTVAIGGHNIKTGTQVKIQASNTNEWSYPEINETLTVNPDLIVKFLSSKKFYKYWRFLFGSQGDLEIGRLWLGEYLQISPSSLNGFSVVKKRSDNVIHGKNRQKWAVPGIGWRRFELSFPRTAEAMIYQLSQMYDDVGNHSSLIFCNFDDLVNYELVRPCYVSIDGDIGFSHTKRQKYEWSLNLEEEK